MSKIKSIFFCQNCGFESPKWMGKCNSCGAWNSFIEEKVVTGKKNQPSVSFGTATSPEPIRQIKLSENARISTGNDELNRVLGGGIVPGSLILIGGEPGIGKSTLMLQVALRSSLKFLYVSGEESPRQIRLRAERIGIMNESCYVYGETQLEKILGECEKLNPDILIVDSIQTAHTDRIDSSPGSLTQVRECAVELLKYSKIKGLPVFIIGHINKDGLIAGPKVLEHIVDTVLQFEGDRNFVFRILRATKNRFGSVSEIGIFEMHENGLQEVANPSELFLSGNGEYYSGSAVAATIEGIRPLLIEIQALVSSAVYGNPQRTTTGYDVKRLNMMLAVLEKRAGFRLASKDVFLNVTGGIRINDPSTDLAVISAILSSDQDMPVPAHVCFAGEIGLSGEIRAVDRIEQRISEAEKLGFKEFYLSELNKKSLPKNNYKIKLIFVQKVEEVFTSLFG